MVNKPVTPYLFIFISAIFIALSGMLDFKRHRGTVSVDTPKGILVVSYNGRTFYLPGGGAEKGESRKDAAIRELKEETSLETVACSFLFE